MIEKKQPKGPSESAFSGYPGSAQPAVRKPTVSPKKENAQRDKGKKK